MVKSTKVKYLETHLFQKNFRTPFLRSCLQAKLEGFFFFFFLKFQWTWVVAFFFNDCKTAHLGVFFSQQISYTFLILTQYWKHV